MTSESENVPDNGVILSALGSPEVLEERLTLVSAAADAPVRLGTFTDEELAALDDLTLTPAQPSPWFGSLTDDEKQIALTAALRGLAARGVFAAEPVNVADRTYTAHLEAGLGALLTMRRYVPHVVIAERTTAEFVDWAVVYPQRDGVFLSEYVDQRGLHAFEIANSSRTASALATWVGAFARDAPDLDVTLGRAEVEAQPATLAPLAEALISTNFTRLGPKDEQEMSWSAIYTGPDGSYVSTPLTDSVRYQGLDLDGVTAHLLAAIA